MQKYLYSYKQSSSNEPHNAAVPTAVTSVILNSAAQKSMTSRPLLPIYKSQYILEMPLSLSTLQTHLCRPGSSSPLSCSISLQPFCWTLWYVGGGTCVSKLPQFSGRKEVIPSIQYRNIPQLETDGWGLWQTGSCRK